MKALFMHTNAEYGFRPRHPIVCALDILGMIIALALIALYRPSFAVLILPSAVVLQYLVSLAYHWLPYSLSRKRIDQMVICMLIGATFVPYWGTKLQPAEGLFRIGLVLGGVVFGCAIVYRYLLSRPYLVAVTYAFFAATGVMTTMRDLPHWLPPLGVFGFWVGVICYLIQQIIHIRLKPDLYPGLFGHSEIRHVFLIVATTAHVLVVVTYL